MGESGTASTTACVVVARAGGGCPAALADSLSRRAVTIRTVGNVYAAMASASALHRAGSACFVVLTEGAAPGAERLLEALGRYAPGAAVWEFDELRGMSRFAPRAAAPKVDVAPVVAAPRPAPLPALKTVAKAAERPRLRLAGEGALPPVASRDSETAPPLHEEIAGRARPAIGGSAAMTPDGPAAPVLTSEELEMLLGEAPGDKRAAGGPGGGGAGA